MKKVIVNVLKHEKRIAILEDNVPAEFYIDRADQVFRAGNIYKGKVVDVLPGMEAAFIDIGDENNAYLHVKDCQPAAKAISQCVQQGQELIVQIVKEATGNKGAKVTCQISLAGQYGVYLPLEHDIGVSRRIKDEGERERLVDIAKTVLSHHDGAIIRTQAKGIEPGELALDLHILRTRWETGMEQVKKVSPPVLLCQEEDYITKLARDIMSNEVDEVIIDDLQIVLYLRGLLKQYRPEFTDKIRLYQRKEGIFSYYKLEEELNKGLERKVWLKSGGYLIIDHTEALTVIDVNTGKFIGTDQLERTVVKTNKEACYEIARQLRLRDLAGMIIIDFINTEEEESRQEILDTMEKALQKDRTRTCILGFTRLGLLELTRKRIRENLPHSLTRECPCCKGKGRILSFATLAANLERELKEYARTGEHEAIVVEMNPSAISYMEGTDCNIIARFREELQLSLIFAVRSNLREDQYHIAFMGKIEDAEGWLAKEKS